MDYEQEINLLKDQVKTLRRKAIEHSMYIDTVSSALWKRVIWWFEGFHFNKVGRWYKENWTPNWPK